MPLACNTDVALFIDEPSSFQSEVSEVRGTLTHHAGACSVDPSVWFNLQMEFGWQDPAGHHGPG